MNNEFDELAKGLAQSVTRRQAFKKLGLAIFGALTASLGLERTSAAQGHQGVCEVRPNIAVAGTYTYTGRCVDPTTCLWGFSSRCPQGQVTKHSAPQTCGLWVVSKGCSF
jgi:hypothetical protein